MDFQRGIDMLLGKQIVYRFRLFFIIAIFLMLLLGETNLASVEPVRAQSNHRVVLDPGHGWREGTGATGNGMVEAEITLDVAKRAKAILEGYGINVALTRTGPEPNTSLREADDRANAFRPDVIVSIHVNAGGGTGTEACYVVDKSTSRASQRLARLLTNKVASQVQLKNRGIFAENRPGERCGNNHYLYIHWMNAPAALIELAFIDGPRDNDVRKLRERRQDFAQAIAEAVMAYLNITPPSTPMGYTFCAWENERCSFSGTRDVAYGANGRFVYRRNVRGGVDCNNRVFGDPIRGVYKACYTRASSSTSGSGPSGYTLCARENERCSFSGTRDVAYGANGRFVYRRNVRGGVDCNNRVFGDPIRGVYKACYTRPVKTTESNLRCNDGTEPNDTWNQGYWLKSGRAVKGNICPKNDPDWYRFEVRPGDEVRLRLTGLPKDYDMAFYVGKEKVALSDNGGRTSEEIVWRVRGVNDKTTAYVKVYGWGGAWDAKPYQLRLDIRSGSSKRPSSANIAGQAHRSPDGPDSNNAFDGRKETFWREGLGHGFRLTLSWDKAMRIERILVWDRPQNSPDNNQINKILIELSNGKRASFGMDSQGQRCVNILLGPAQTVRSITLKAADASGHNGLSEIEVWTGEKRGGLRCGNQYFWRP